MHQCQFLSFDRCTTVTQDVNVRRKWMKGIWNLSVLFVYYSKTKGLFLK